LAQVDTIEIEREMVRGGEQFRPWNELAYSDPRSRIVIDDAKTFFATQPQKYDAIVSEPSNPWVSGVAGLFSDEFYRLTRRHLAAGGVFVQWIQLYDIDVPLVVSVLKALEANFGDYQAYAATDGDLLIAARESGPMGAVDAMWLRDLFLRRAPVEGQVVQSAELHEHARAVSEWLRECERRPVPLTSLVRVLEAMVADLTPGDLDAVWWALVSTGCPRRFSAQDRAWVALLQAIGRRDGARMAAAARQLFAAEPQAGLPSQRYLVAAGMLGSIAAGRPADARELWERY